VQRPAGPDAALPESGMLVMGLKKRPEGLMRPELVLLVLRGNLRPGR
jgi:hypothetical protein